MTARPGAAHFLRDAAGWTQAWGLAIDGSVDWLADNVTLAGDSRARRTGLLGRDALPAGQALVLAPCQGIHTFGMRFPIDVVGVTRDGRVVKIIDSLPPRRVALAWRAFAIVELAAGRCRDAGLSVGTVLRPARLDLIGGRPFPSWGKL